MRQMRCGFAARWLIAAAACMAVQAAETVNKLNVGAVDSQGQPVTGLHSSDFQLAVDGKTRPIEFFRFTGNEANRSTVVLIDLLSDRLLTGSMIVEEITKAFKDLESSDRLYMYILTSSGTLYPVHPLPAPDSQAPPAGGEPWTRNIGPVLQAAFKTVFGLRPIDERDIVVRYQMTTNALRELGGQMKLLSGRKNLIWVSHGVPLVGPSISSQGLVDFTNPLRLLCEELERAEIVVYPVVESSRGAGAAPLSEGEQSLEEFSMITGGRLYRSGGVGEALRQATADARGNYEIVYSTEAGKPDGKHHKLRVTSAKKEVRLQTAAGFYGVLAPAQTADVERNAGLLAAHSAFDATEIGVQAKAAADPEKDTNLRFQIRIEAGDLWLREAGDKHTGKLALLFAVYGKDGVGLSNPMPIEVSLTAEQYAKAMKEGLGVQQTMPVAAGVERVRVIVVDRDLGAAGSATVAVAR